MMMTTNVDETKDPCSDPFQVIEAGVSIEGNERSTLSGCVVTGLSNFIGRLCQSGERLSEGDDFNYVGPFHHNL